MIWIVFVTASATLRHVDDMISRVFPNDDTVRKEAELDAHLASTGAVRAGVVLLLKDLRCGGRPCKQTTTWGACTYLDQAVRSIGSLLSVGSLLGKYPQYPILLYHTDWTEGDRKLLESNTPPHTAWWHRVVFGPDSLPPYLYDVNRTIAGWREHHVDGDLARPTKNNIHGFGYMLMCRLYAGLIHHAPLARRLDYYLRVDGDSRLSAVRADPFVRMHNNGKKYATLGRGTYKEVAGAALALPRLLNKRFQDAVSVVCPESKAACPKPGSPCVLTCSTNDKLPVPLCRGRNAVAHCPAFYNNFEIVDMRAFRTLYMWELFLLAEQANVFLCEQSQHSKPGKCGGGGMGDAAFRTLQVHTLLKPSDIDHLGSSINYRHPVPIKSFCNTKTTTDGGPSVLRFA